MLKKLGRRLTLLNVLISGAILIVMALVSLSVTEGLMATRNENELRAQMGMVVSAVRAEELDGAQVKLAMPRKYTIYVKDVEAKQKLMTDQVISDSEAESVLSDVNISFEELAPGDAHGAQRMLFSTHVTRGDADEAGETTANMAYVWVQGSIALSTVNDTPYRIGISTIGASDGAEDMLLVMQDRTDELAERDRLRVLFAGCVLGALALIVLSSLFFSAKAVAPIEASIAQQRMFVAAASHELRTPIASVRANAEVLCDAELGEYQPYLAAIVGEGEKMSRLIGDLLNLARADAGELPLLAQPLDVADVAADAAGLIAPLAEQAGLSVQTRLRPALITGDPDRLRQVLVALLDNAVRHVGAGGTVRVATGKRDHRAWIVVEDDGPGIPDEHKPRAFDRFYRVDSARSREHGGAGLGLAIAKELTERMGGEIELRDRDGGGCAFHISFHLAG